MILLLILQILFGLMDGEKIVFANDSRYNVYAVQIQFNNEIVFRDTLPPNTQTEYQVYTNTQYQINWIRLTQYGEYHRFPKDYEKQNKTEITNIVLSPNKMVTIHLAPQDIP